MSPPSLTHLPRYVLTWDDLLCKFLLSARQERAILAKVKGAHLGSDVRSMHRVSQIRGVFMFAALVWGLTSARGYSCGTIFVAMVNQCLVCNTAACFVEIVWKTMVRDHSLPMAVVTWALQSAAGVAIVVGAERLMTSVHYGEPLWSR